MITIPKASPITNVSLELNSQGTYEQYIKIDPFQDFSTTNFTIELSVNLSNVQRSPNSLLSCYLGRPSSASLTYLCLQASLSSLNVFVMIDDPINIQFFWPDKLPNGLFDSQWHDLVITLEPLFLSLNAYVDNTGLVVNKASGSNQLPYFSNQQASGVFIVGQYYDGMNDEILLGNNPMVGKVDSLRCWQGAWPQKTIESQNGIPPYCAADQWEVVGKANLKSLAIDGNAMFALGLDGSVLSSVDSGQTWGATQRDASAVFVDLTCTMAKDGTVYLFALDVNGSIWWSYNMGHFFNLLLVPSDEIVLKVVSGVVGGFQLPGQIGVSYLTQSGKVYTYTGFDLSYQMDGWEKLFEDDKDDDKGFEGIDNIYGFLFVASGGGLFYENPAAVSPKFNQIQPPTDSGGDALSLRRIVSTAAWGEEGNCTVALDNNGAIYSYQADPDGSTTDTVENWYAISPNYPMNPFVDIGVLKGKNVFALDNTGALYQSLNAINNADAMGSQMPYKILCDFPFREGYGSMVFDLSTNNYEGIILDGSVTESRIGMSDQWVVNDQVDIMPLVTVAANPN